MGSAAEGNMDSLDDEPETTRGTGRPAWAVSTLAAVLIFTTVVDVLGNLLVIVAVLRNRKLRNAGGNFRSYNKSEEKLLKMLKKRNALRSVIIV